MLSNRKYEKGTIIKNEKGLKLFDRIDYYKIVIGRKEKPKRNDNCIKYICYLYDNSDNFRGCLVLEETIIDKIIG